MIARIIMCWLLFSAPLTAMEVSIKGVSDGGLTDNISAYLSTIDLPSGCVLNPDFQSTVETQVNRAAQAMGYYHSQILQLTFTNDKTCNKLLLELDSGQPINIEKVDISINGEAQTDEDFIRLKAQFPLKAGDILRHSKYSTGKRRFDSLALARGYFDGQFTQQRLEVDTEKNLATIILQYDSGIRYAFGELIGAHDLRADELIHKVRPFEVGQKYDSNVLAKFNQDLRLTEFFQQVVARPVVNKAENGQVPIEIIATSKPRDLFNVGGGASTDSGPRGKFSWQRPWVNSDGHSMNAELFVSEPRQTLSFRYRIPIENPLHDFVSLQAGLKSENDNDTKSETLSVAAQRHWASDSNEWNQIAFVRYERETFTQAELDEQTTDLLIPGFTLSRHRSLGGLDAHWGDLQQITIEAANDVFISDINLLRVTGQTKWLRSFGEHRIFLRAKGGAVNTNSFAELPSSLRYFAGGDQSVRGFGYQELGPKDPESGQLLGGRYLNEASVEYSYPIDNDWRIAVFTDVGNASDKPFENLAYGYGLGFSWASPVGPIRFYLAQGVSEDERKIRFHFSMGPVL